MKVLSSVIKELYSEIINMWGDHEGKEACLVILENLAAKPLNF